MALTEVSPQSPRPSSSGFAEAPKTARLDWANVIFLTLSPLAAIIGAVLYVHFRGFGLWELGTLATMYFLTGMSITAGYHRLYSHKSYNCSRIVEFLYLVFGAAACENSALLWSSDHRNHHQFVDQEDDPYNILKGGFYAHMGWILFKNKRSRELRFKNVPDLLRNPLVMWQDRWYLPLAVGVGFVLPTLWGWAWGHPLGGFLWGGLLRVVVVQHMTFLINSAAHLYGKRPYSLANTARDSWWLGPLTFGEGYHNFHHKFPSDYRNGVRPHQFDITKWSLLLMRSVGLADNLRATPEALILKARMEVQLATLSDKFSPAPLPHGALAMLKTRLDSAKRSIELAFASYQEARRDYASARNAGSAQAREALAGTLRGRRTEFTDLARRWREAVGLLSRMPASSAQILTITAALDLLK